MKYSTIVALYISLSCLCSIVVKSDENPAGEGPQSLENGENKDNQNCSLWVPDDKALQMPIAFTTNGRRSTILYPDRKQHLIVGHNRSFKLSCATAKFASSSLQNGSEALVTCAGGDSLRYRGRAYRYEDFRCDGMPKSELRVTQDTCQPNNYTVAVVGFRTKYVFLELYKTCFDKSARNSLYSWFDARTPYYDNHQKTKKRPSFVKSKELYGNTDVNKKYTVDEQKKTIAKILRSDELADKYIKSDSKHSLSRGHYAAKADFFFGFEQSATFYYANVAPQWQIFNGNKWAHLEELTRDKMDNDTATARHLIVTGTYGSCTLPDVDGVQQPLFLDLPDGIPVPLFYWKLYYDLDKQDGLVYVGLNNPYKEIDDSVYVCPNVCPDGYDKHDGSDGDEQEDANQGLIYCCTKESFEKVYGQLDPIVFQQI